MLFWAHRNREPVPLPACSGCCPTHFAQREVGRGAGGAAMPGRNRCLARAGFGAALQTRIQAQYGRWPRLSVGQGRPDVGAAGQRTHRRTYQHQAISRCLGSRRRPRARVCRAARRDDRSGGRLVAHLGEPGQGAQPVCAALHGRRSDGARCIAARRRWSGAIARGRRGRRGSAGMGRQRLSRNLHRPARAAQARGSRQACESGSALRRCSTGCWPRLARFLSG